MQKTVKKSFIDSLPVLVGYLVLGMGFGVILSSKGYKIPWALLMSATILSGTGQYILPELMATGVSLLTVALTIFTLNARYAFYGVTLIDKFKDAGWKKPFLIFWITDETYSIVVDPPIGMSQGEYINYAFFVGMFDQIYWIIGSILGVLVGSLLPESFVGVDFILTALFMTVFTEQCSKATSFYPAIVGVLSAVFCLLIFGKDNFLIPSLILILILLFLFRKRIEGKKGGEND